MIESSVIASYQLSVIADTAIVYQLIGYLFPDSLLSLPIVMRRVQSFVI